MKEFGIFLLFVVGLLIGGVLGYTIATNNMKHEAVANGAAEWTMHKRPTMTINGTQYDEEFTWLHSASMK